MQRVCFAAGGIFEKPEASFNATHMQHAFDGMLYNKALHLGVVEWEGDEVLCRRLADFSSASGLCLCTSLRSATSFKLPCTADGTTAAYCRYLLPWRLRKYARHGGSLVAEYIEVGSRLLQ